MKNGDDREQWQFLHQQDLSSTQAKVLKKIKACQYIFLICKWLPLDLKLALKGQSWGRRWNELTQKMPIHSWLKRDPGYIISETQTQARNSTPWLCVFRKRPQSAFCGCVDIERHITINTQNILYKNDYHLSYYTLTSYFLTYYCKQWMYYVYVYKHMYY